jgi:hypothetical protein
MVSTRIAPLRSTLLSGHFLERSSHCSHTPCTIIWVFLGRRAYSDSYALFSFLCLYYSTSMGRGLEQRASGHQQHLDMGNVHRSIIDLLWIERELYFSVAWCQELLYRVLALLFSLLLTLSLLTGFFPSTSKLGFCLLLHRL